MIITLKGADFSSNNINQYLTNWSISPILNSAAATYNGVTSVPKDPATGLNATVTINEGYELNGDVTVTMGGSPLTSGVTVNGKIITIIIAAVTGNVVIKVPTKNTATDDEGNESEKTQYTLTINPNPIDATVTMNGSNRKTITVDAGSEVSWSVSKTDYETQRGTWTANKNETLSVKLNALDIPESELTLTTLEFTTADANYYVKLADGTHSDTAQWTTTPPVLLTRLADGANGYCINPLQGHAAVASVAYYSGDSGTSADYISGLGGGNSSLITTGERVSLTAQQIKDNAPEGAVYVTFSTHVNYGTITLTILQPSAGGDNSGGDDEPTLPPENGEVVIKEYTNQGYIIRNTGSSSGGMGEITVNTTWIHTDLIPINSLTDGIDGYCTSILQGHGNVANIAYYSRNERVADACLGTWGMAQSETTQVTVEQVNANKPAGSTPAYVAFTTYSTHTPLRVSVIE